MQGILGMLADRQINTAVGIVEPGNLAVRRMIERVAPDATMRVEDDVLVVTIPGSGRHAA
jgi:hypothetical protein